MKTVKNKLKKQGGFTLVEMLTVVAIIAILIAISIPMVTGALDRARKATDAANERAAKAEMSIVYLTDSSKCKDASGNPIVKVYDAVEGQIKDDLADVKTAYSKEKAGEVICVVVYKDVVYYQWVNKTTGTKPTAPTTDPTTPWETEVPAF